MAVAAIGIISSIFSLGSSIKAGTKRRRAAKAQRGITSIRNQQAKRQFIANFRRRQAEQLLEGAREGGFESSRFQGQAAALSTRAEVLLTEQRQQASLGADIGQALEQANRQDEIAALGRGIGAAASAFK